MAVTAGPRPAPRAGRRRGRWVDAVLVLAVVALFAVPLLLRAGEADQSYAGTDTRAGEVVAQTDPGYRPWTRPLFAPSSGEVQSGLFALQAALGAGALGFVLGRLSGRRSRSG